MGWINASWKLLATVAVMQFHRRCVVLALLWKLLSYARVFHKNFWVFSSNGGVFSVCGFSYLALQSFKLRVWSVDTSVHTQSSLSDFTTLSTVVLSSLHSGVVVKFTIYLHQNPSWLWLVWTNSPVFTLTGYRLVGTTVQIMPRLHRIMDTHQVCKYPDSTISKILKWWMITTLNREVLEKQRLQLLPTRYT